MQPVVLDASMPLDRQQWRGLQCPEHIGPWSRVGGRVLRADGSQRFGRVRTEHGAAWELRIDQADPLMPDGTRRCEVLAYADHPDTALPVGRDFVFSMRFRVVQGQVAADQVCLAQWHQHGGPPLLGLYLQAGTLGITARHGAGTAAQTHHLWRSAAAIDGWQDVAMHACIAQPHGLLRVWHQGVLVAQYAGPLGNRERPAPYAKAGLYWWPQDNTWDGGHPERVLHVSRVRFKPVPDAVSE